LRRLPLKAPADHRESETVLLFLPALIIAHTALVVLSDTTKYVVLNHGRAAGEMVVVAESRSARVRFRYIDRDHRTPQQETRYQFSAQDVLASAEVVRLNLDGSTGAQIERFAVRGDSVSWSSSDRSGGARASAPEDRNKFYSSTSETPFDQALLARFLLRQPGHTARLWPAGTARLELVTDTTLPTPAGPTRLRLARVSRENVAPYHVWLDERHELYASEAVWFVTIRRGVESVLPVLRGIELGRIGREAEAIARQVSRPVGGTLVIDNGDVFDSEHGAILPRTTVIVQGDRVVAVGPAGSLTLPSDATVIDASGKTVLPGLWDTHVHTGLHAQERNSVLRLAAGITTARDLGADLDIAVSDRDRAAAGLLAAPRLILAGFIEGPGVRAGPSEAIVSTADAARAWVARYDSLGYRQIKLYNLIPPELVGVIADEARRRGLRVSGHVPRGTNAFDVVRLGYHEINHAEFLMRMLLSPGARTIEGAQLTQMIELLRSNQITIEPTLNYYYPNFASRPADWDATYGRLTKLLYDGGVLLLAGSDGGVANYLEELRLLERAGIPAANVLQIATLNGARAMKDDANYGSIARGKVADIIVVNGRPAESIADLARIETVIRAGRLYRVSDLRAELNRQPRDAGAPAGMPRRP
jgi:imidazolonepropionase-like amidohydrolase